MSHRKCLVKGLKERGWIFDKIMLHSDNSNDIRMYFGYELRDRKFVSLSCCMDSDEYQRMYKKAVFLEIRSKRSSFRVISGGMAWVPQGLKLNPTGRLKLVKKAA